MGRGLFRKKSKGLVQSGITGKSAESGAGGFPDMGQNAPADQIVVELNKGLKDKLNAVENPATWPFLVFEDARVMMKEVVRDKVRTFGSAGRI